MAHIDDALNILRRAQASYNSALKQVDSKLRAAVAQNPSLLGAAHEIQRMYVDGLFVHRLHAHEQPPAPPAPEPTPEPTPEPEPAPEPPADPPVEVITDPVAIEQALADTENA